MRPRFQRKKIHRVSQKFTEGELLGVQALSGDSAKQWLHHVPSPSPTHHDKKRWKDSRHDVKLIAINCFWRQRKMQSRRSSPEKVRGTVNRDDSPSWEGWARGMAGGQPDDRWKAQWRWDGTINRSDSLLAIENPSLNLPLSDGRFASQRPVADPSRCRV